MLSDAESAVKDRAGVLTQHLRTPITVLFTCLDIVSLLREGGDKVLERERAAPA